MSNKIIKLPCGIKFGITIIKYKNEDNKNIQKVAICLRKSNKVIVSPVTSLLHCCSSNAVKTQYSYGLILINLLNFLYFDKKYIKCFCEINTNMIIDYLNYLNDSGKSRSYVQDNIRMLTKIFYYATYRYENVCEINLSGFIISKEKRKTYISWPVLKTKVLLPSAKTNQIRKVNKITNMDINLVFRFLEIAMQETPNCALGFYFLFFGGLRGSETCHLTDSNIPAIISGDSNIYVNIEDKILNIDSKYCDLNQNKKNRRQEVFVVKSLFLPLLEQWKNKYKTGPIVRNHSNQAMTIRGLQNRFEKVKPILFDKLRNGDPEDMLLLSYYENLSWSTHIGRGFFSNLVAMNTDNPYNVSVARGDSNFSSALPYIDDSPQTMNLKKDTFWPIHQEQLSIVLHHISVPCSVQGG